MMRQLVLSIIVCPLVNACGSPTVITESTPQQVCNSWLPIFPSRKDVLTRGTEEQIAANNKASEVWCGKREVPKEQPAKVADAR